MTKFFKNEWIQCFIIAIICIIVAFHKMLFVDHLVGPGGTDSRHINYILEHFWGWISGDKIHSSFWNMPFFFPAPNVTAYSELLFSYSFLYWPWRILGLQFDTAFVAWIYSVAFLNFISAYYLLRKVLSNSHAASLIGAFIMVFAQSHIRHFDHVHLFPFFYIIGIFISIICYFNNNPKINSQNNSKWVLMFFSCIVGQTYGCYYLMYFMGIILFTAFIFGVFFRKTRKIMLSNFIFDYKIIIISSLLSILLVLPLAIHFLSTLNLVGPRNWEFVKMLLPRPSSWIFNMFAYTSSWMNSVPPWNTLPGSTARWEHSFGLGIITTSVTLFTLIKYRKIPLFSLLLFCSLAIIILTTLFFDRFTLWFYIWKYIPSGSALRAIARIGVFLSIPAGIAIAHFISVNCQSKYKFLFFSIAILCTIEQIAPVFTYNLLNTRNDIDNIAKKIDPSKEAFVCIITNGSSLNSSNWIKFQLDSMFASNAASIPTINGYSSNFPSIWTNGVENIIIKDNTSYNNFNTSLGLWLSKWSIDQDKIQVLTLD